MRPPFTVVVHASTSNLGPGFDLCGLALSLPLEVRVLGAARGATHRLVGLEGTARDWVTDESNLVLRALALGAARLGVEPGPLELAVRSEIPLARGLGSSGAAVAAGLGIAAALAGRDTPDAPGRDDPELLAWATELEGHPDNVAPALFGGCTLAAPLGGGRVRLVRQRLAPGLAFGVAWPAHELATRAARAALPASVPFADAVENPRRLALLLEGLRTADPDLLAAGAEDRLHVRYRLPLVPGGAEALAAAREAGAWLATVSGSGSALFAIAAPGRIAAVVEALRAELDRHAGPAEGRVVTAAPGRTLRPGSL